MGVIYKYIFLHLADKEAPSEIGRGTRIALAFVISFIFVSSIVVLMFFSLTATDKELSKRIAAGGLAVLMGFYYLRLLLAMRKRSDGDDPTKHHG